MALPRFTSFFFATIRRKMPFHGDFHSCCCSVEAAFSTDESIFFVAFCGAVEKKRDRQHWLEAALVAWSTRSPSPAPGFQALPRVLPEWQKFYQVKWGCMKMFQLWAKNCKSLSLPFSRHSSSQFPSFFLVSQILLSFLAALLLLLSSCTTTTRLLRPFLPDYKSGILKPS